MDKSKLLRGATITLIVCFIAVPASANVFLPVIVAFAGPGMILAFIPIVLIEGLILSRYGVSFGMSFLAVTVANVVSTIVGIPIAIVMEIFSGERLYKEQDFTKDVYNETLGIFATCFIVFFLLSFWIEAGVAGWFNVGISDRNLTEAIAVGNLTTYGILFSIIFGVVTYTARDMLRETATKYVESPENYVDSCRILAESRDWKTANAAGGRGFEYLRQKEEEIAERIRNDAVSVDASSLEFRLTSSEFTGDVVPYRTRSKASVISTDRTDEKKEICVLGNTYRGHSVGPDTRFKDVPEMENSGNYSILEEVRKAHAKDYGLLENADWEKIYNVWAKEWKFWPSVTLRAILIAGVPTILPAFWIGHWIAFVIAIIFFAAIVFVMFFVHGFALEDQYYCLLHSGMGGDEFIKRAKRDEIYV